jgi:hypothetical protein
MSLARTQFGEKPSDTWRGLQGDLYKDILPPVGFVLPQPGTIVQCLTDYLTPFSPQRLVIPAGAVGTVQECRTPEVSGWHGMSMCFDEIAFVNGPYGQRKPAYSAGLIVPYDYAADPKIFSYGRNRFEYSP